MTCGYSQFSSFAAVTQRTSSEMCERGELSLSESDSSNTYRSVRYAPSRPKSTNLISKFTYRYVMNPHTVLV